MNRRGTWSLSLASARALQNKHLIGGPGILPPAPLCTPTQLPTFPEAFPPALFLLPGEFLRNTFKTQLFGNSSSVLTLLRMRIRDIICPRSEEARLPGSKPGWARGGCADQSPRAPRPRRRVYRGRGSVLSKAQQLPTAPPVLPHGLQTWGG